jgi:sugar phosphate isomerase/epimerase
MKPLKIGIVAESTQLPLRAAIEAAARMGAKAVQVDATGPLAPDALGGTGRRELRNLLRSFDLDLAALNVPIRRGLDVADDLEPRLDRVRKSMQLAFDLGARRAVVPCPKLPDDAARPARCSCASRCSRSGPTATASAASSHWRSGTTRPRR